MTNGKVTSHFLYERYDSHDYRYQIDVVEQKL